MAGKSFFYLVNIYLLILVGGCTSVPAGSFHDLSTSELAFGYIQVQSEGAHPRGSPTRVRFFSLTHEETGARFRVNVNSASDVFSVRLPAGTYVIDRVQFNEGPFMAESHVQFTFHVPKGKAAYLGVWQFTVETPRTIRLVRIHMLEGDPEFPKTFAAALVSEQTPIETVLPKPETFETRVFQVDPNPKVKYFRRR